MALRQIVLARKLEALRAQQTEADKQAEALAEKRATLEKREAELTQALEEVTEETPQEDKDALDAEVSQFEADSKGLEGEEQESETQRQAIKNQIAELEKELAEIESRSSSSFSAKEKRKDEKPMETRKFFGMNPQERDAMFAREDVKTFMTRLREMGREKRAISGGDLLIPDVFLGIIRQETAESSKLLKHVTVRSVPGTSRMTVAGAIPEAVWTEMCAKLNELALSFTNVEMDGYKVGGFIPVCNALLEDSDISLATEVLTAIGRAIGRALDKAILYGTGTKMPLGIVTRLAQTSKPSDYPTTARAWADLHTSNLKSFTGKTGVELFKELAKASGAIRNDYASGAKFWAMNEATKLALTVEAMSLNSAGAIVTGMQGTMPVIGGAIETLDFIPDNQIIGGYGELYLLAERAGTQLSSSEHYRFVEDQTVFKGTARYDGMPVIAEGFVGIGIAGTAPDADDVTFAADTANPKEAALKSLAIGSLSLNPAFDSETLEYSASTTTASSKVTAEAEKTGATVEIKNGSTAVSNGGTATWASGENVLTIKVKYGTTVRNYKVTVTKS